MSGLNDIIFVKGQGGLGRVLPNEDHITGLLFGKTYAHLETPPTLPFSDCKLIASLADAVTKGITLALYPDEYAQIKEFFTLNPSATLYIAFETAEAGAFDYLKIETMQNFSGGKIRQFGIYVDSIFAVADLAEVQTILTRLETEHKPCSCIYTADFSTLTLAALTDLRARTENKISVLLASDDNGIPTIGNILGIISLSAVHENIGWIEKFRADLTGNYAEAYFGTGEAFGEVSAATLEAVNTKGYIFMRNHVGIAGSYYNDSHCCIPLSSDYAYLENNRTIDKAIRGIRTYLLPKLNSPLEINPTDGTLSIDTIKTFENLGGRALEQMLKDGELSGFKVTVPAAQDVLSTSELIVTVQLVIMGVARTITVTVGFTASVS